MTHVGVQNKYGKLTTPLPIPEVLIKVSCVGICGSDIQIYSTGRCGMDSITEPLIMGHEGAGVIVKVSIFIKILSQTKNNITWLVTCYYEYGLFPNIIRSTNFARL